MLVEPLDHPGIDDVTELTRLVVEYVLRLTVLLDCPNAVFKLVAPPVKYTFVFGIDVYAITYPQSLRLVKVVEYHFL